MTTDSIVDFDPAHLDACIQRKDHIAFVFRQQILYAGESMQFVHCEIRVWGGRLVTPASKIPRKVDNVGVAYRGGSRRCFLPVGFRAFDNCVLSVEKYRYGSPDKSLEVASGRKITLRILRKFEIPDEYFLPPTA